MIEGWKKYKEEMKRTRLHYLIFLYAWLWLCVYGILHWCSNPIILEIKEEGFTRNTYIDEKNLTSSRTRYLPYLGWRPWDVTNNTGYFILFFVQFVGGMSSAIGSITFDVFYISSLMIICAHLRYLNDSLTDVNGDAMSRYISNHIQQPKIRFFTRLIIFFKLRSDTMTLNFELKLKYCVDHHKEILT